MRTRRLTEVFVPLKRLEESRIPSHLSVQIARTISSSARSRTARNLALQSIRRRQKCSHCEDCQALQRLRYSKRSSVPSSAPVERQWKSILHGIQGLSLQ